MASPLVKAIQATSDRAAIYFNEQICNKVFLQGELIWERDIKPRPIDDLELIVTKVSTDQWYSARDGVGASNYSTQSWNESGFNYHKAHGQIVPSLVWLGATITCNAKYVSHVDLTKLPDLDLTEVKKIVIHKYSGKDETIILDGTNYSFDVTDTASANVTQTQYFVAATGCATAGIKSIDYYYTD